MLDSYISHISLSQVLGLSLITLRCDCSCSIADQFMHSLTDWLFSSGNKWRIGSLINLGFWHRNLAQLPLVVNCFVEEVVGLFAAPSTESVGLLVDVSVLELSSLWSGLWPVSDGEGVLTKCAEWDMDITWTSQVCSCGGKVLRLLDLWKTYYITMLQIITTSVRTCVMFTKFAVAKRVAR